MWCLVYEYAGGGNLADLLNASADVKMSQFDWRKRLDVALSIASALECLWKSGCSHRDVKPQNICFTDDLERVMLIDFGLAKFVDDSRLHSSTTTKMLGWSMPYVAPEYMDGQHSFDEKCEVYSFGFVLQALLTGKLPLPTDVPLPFETLVKKAKYEIPGWKATILNEVVEMTMSCVCPKGRRDERITFSTCLDRLLALKTRCAQEATSEQRSTIEVTLTSSTISCISASSTCKGGICQSCGRSGDQGINCNRAFRPHFLCNHCFAQHVKSNLGSPQIICRKGDCLSNPFTMHQLAEILEPALVADHFAAVSQHQRDIEQKEREQLELRYREKTVDHVFQTKVFEVVDSLAREQKQYALAAARARAQHAEGQLKCPNLYILTLPRESRGPRRFNRARFRTKRIYILYFLCSHDQSKVGPGIVLKRDTKWLKTVAPALRASLFLTRIFIRLAVGMSLDLPDWLSQLGTAGGISDENGLRILSEEMDEQLENLEQKLSSIHKDSSSSSSDFDWNKIQQEVHRVSPQAYRYIAQVAEEHLEWRNHMMFCENRSGYGAWIKRENEEHWKSRK